MSVSGRTPVVWAVHDGKIGMANQVLGLAEAVGYPVIEKAVALRAPWRHLALSLWLHPMAALKADGARLEPPWPDLLIACGRGVTALALAVKRASHGRTLWVQVQDPRFARRHVDLMVVPQHDPARGENVLLTVGSVHRVRSASLDAGRARFAPLFATLARPLIGVLIGGNNRVYRLTPEIAASLGRQLAALAAQGFGIAITPSRRTGEAALAAVVEPLRSLPHFIWSGTGENPYLGLLAHADALVVTGDSVNMVSEAASTGKPVHVVPLEGGSAKFRRFHDLFRRAGVARDFTGKIERWSYQPLDDTERAAGEIRRLMSLRFSNVA
ncbi:MAG TPA: mitochondrial fission ELM1 family protein [Stellaceae bacterium]|nr:mitochondrial fission ELM1 family protein [Stellaceae bacterium]